MTYFIRQAKIEDLEKFVDLVFLTSWGITSLPKDKKLIEEKLKLSCRSFEKRPKAPGEELYLFFLEEGETKDIVGVSGIKARVGWDHPLHLLQVRNDSLIPVQITEGPSELCSLYLHPAHRSAGLGKLLSFSRFLFIAAQKERFADEIIAQLRGIFEEGGASPFWRAVGEQQLEITFDELASLVQSDPEETERLMPKRPLSVSGLPKEAQEAVGRPNKSTLPAMRMLQEAGLSPTGWIDPFDGGPILKGKRGAIKPIMESRSAAVKNVRSESFPGARLYLAAKEEKSFRCCLAEIAFDDGAGIDKETAEALQVSEGETIRYLEMQP